MSILLKLFMVILVMGFGGCAILQEFPKTLWGSSTRVLEEARSNAITKTYDQDYWKCLRATIDFLNKKKYVIFKEDDVHAYLVVMGIPGSVDTTEVGIFFVEINDHQTRIELSSLSTNAKRLLAKPLFHGLDIAFGLAPADPESVVVKEEDGHPSSEK